MDFWTNCNLIDFADAPEKAADQAMAAWIKRGCELFQFADGGSRSTKRKPTERESYA